MKKILLVISIIVFSSCNNTSKNYAYDWEYEQEKRDSIKKAKEDSIDRVLKDIRHKSNITMSEDKTVLGGIYLGQSKKDYERERGKIQSELGYKSLGIGDIDLDICDVKFHNGKLYSLTLRHSYLYEEYRREYNSGAEYHPEPYIRDLITHFEKKYGMPDKKYTGYDEIRGHEKADYIYLYWIFPKKRIAIKNEAKKYGGGNDHASYTLTITIDDYNITDMLENEAKMREDMERDRQKKRDSILNKKRMDLSNSI